ncbi:MAG: glycosyltransferase [Lachnospiraceae bacterium]|nr:glycosyltransferase [Lachnospiraceae bacterium]
MKISVVIPTYNEERWLPECLAALAAGTEQPYEVLVADGNSTDSTRKIARRFGAKVLCNPKGHAAGGRNVGILAAKGDVIAFLDADCIPELDWLAQIRAAFEQEDIDGLGAYIEPAEPENKYEDFWGTLSLRILMSYGDEPYYVERKTLNDAFITASCAYTRKLLYQLKGFNNWFANHAEDIDICWRALDAGAKLKYEPKARIKAHSPTDLAGIKRKSFRNGVSSSKLQKVYGSFFNYDLQIYKVLFQNLRDMMRGKKGAYLFVIETLWHLLGKYYGSMKFGLINI